MTTVKIKPSNLFYRIMNSPFLFQAISLSFVVIFVFGFRPENFSIQKQNLFQSEWGKDVNKPYTFSDDGFIYNDQESINSQDTQQRKKTIEYVVKSGDNTTKIAHKFGLKVSTILWMNDLTSKSLLRIGQKIKVPPIDGVYYTVKKHDTLSEIAKAHQADIKKIYAYNRRINPGTKLKTGDKVFIPEASKTFIPRKIIVQKPRYKGSAPSRASIPASRTTKAQAKISSKNLKLIRPTHGILTQGFHRRHYALDIANKMNTPIYAAKGGKVITSKDGWNYGYGNYIILDHGDGVTTLYGHMNQRKVAVGETVKAGQLIGLMGNTGRVFGVTGIHLHFEVRINGRKRNPNHYF
ncbi:hypothetical protein CSB37_01440 [bacterium DOLZORAL124_38_8]|nr:MAG: hypothetical protein CSB37_01440 [bacterium DOLZORAL124_38_8]